MKKSSASSRPESKIGAIGAPAIRTDEVDEVFAILKSREVAVEGQTWNRRYREYMEKIKTGSVFEIAEVLRDLQRLKGDKELSFGERKMLDTARTRRVVAHLGRALPGAPCDGHNCSTRGTRQWAGTPHEP